MRRRVFRLIVTLVAAAVMVGLAGTLRRLTASTGPPTFRVGEQNRVGIMVAPTPVGRRIITLRLAGRRLAIVDDGTVPGYVVPLTDHAPGDVLTVEVKPPADVEVVPPSPELSQSEADWQPETVRALGPPVSVPGGVEASVNESDTYGLRLFGIPVRTEPRKTAARVGTVWHADRLVASCWTTGDPVSNGFEEVSFDDTFTYTSDVWYQVTIPGDRRGYIPDTRFARSPDHLGLPHC